ncbi:MAG TPA: type I-C CRISPR-associated protein Cas8c/Csd1 [Ktedonobacterales bacterium]|nr:type I-C CRISPR-associated protein Cas8c/Csd1 [Ktedonobacterales bacterium]
MLLQRLSEYADQLDLPPAMYQSVAIRYVIMLDRAGRYLNIVDRASQKQKSGVERLAPDCKRSSAIKPKLLADNAEYVLGIGRPTGDAARVSAQHAAFVELVRNCATVTGEPAVEAVARFLAELAPQHLNLPDDFDPGARMTFEVDGSYPIDLPRVCSYWASAAAATSDEDPLMQCLVCGQVRPAVERLPILIKGIPGGQPMGMTLISANEEAFLSYGLKASLIAPTCEDCGQRFGNALNALLQREDTHLKVPPVVYIFWAREPMEFSLVSMFSQAKPDEVRQFLQAPWHSKPEAAHLDTVPFYAAALSASGARIAIRDWIETTLGETRRHLERYFALQQLVGSDDQTRWFPLWRLTKATINSRAKGEEPAPQVVEALLHLALKGGPLPDWLLYQVIRRIRAEKEVYPARAALIKMVLLSQQSDFEGEDDMAELDLSNRDPAYLCGRLLAELENIQEAALGNVNQSIVDRYYGTASSAPALVFGRLLEGAQKHLAKLHRDKPGAYFSLDERLREILSGIDGNTGFPKTLTLRNQGLFALGYYHERVANIRAAQAKRAAKESSGTPPPPEEQP